MKRSLVPMALAVLVVVTLLWVSSSPTSALKKSAAGEEAAAGSAAQISATRLSSSDSGESERERSEQFAALADETLRALPRIADLRALSPEEAHTTPAAIIRAGIALGRVARALEEHHELVPAGIAFYQRCSTTEDLPDQIRALCYADARNLSVQAINGLSVNAQVLALAKRIPSNTR